MASWREPFLGSTLPKSCNPDLLSCIQEALAGRYRVERELGRGGMATVYLAEDLKRHRSAAVKVLNAELGQLMASDRFLREIEVTAGLDHPHILPVQDSGESGGLLYYVTPYVEGGSLRDRLKQQARLSLDEALRITREVAGALAYAHRHGVVHRDIKPGNLLLGQGGVRVADFGIARAIAAAGEEKLTPTGLAIGTPAYMSPEQSSASEVLDGRSDIYSLACVLYEMLAGEPPYTGPSGRAVIAKHMSEPIPRISVVRETVTPAVEQALLKALAKAPEDRFATADQFADALTTSDMVTIPVPAAIAPARSRVQALDGFWAALAGHYSVERELGRGGMAIVFLARDLKHDRPVAVKIIRPELGSVVGVERFQREIDLAAKLQHPNIMPVHDSGSADDRLYYVMPYVEGESLRARLTREGQLPLEDALEIAREVANALGYAHGRGVVHRDVKPENILLSGGHALVLDFGIARALAGAPAQRLTETGLVIGTPDYMSPEQATGERQVDGRSDLYSLGCVLYEMLSGEPPYTGLNAQAVIAKRLIEPIPHLRTLREGTPEAVEDAVTRALAKSPADRFATAAEFAAALAPSAITATRLRISSRWRLSRRPAVVAAAVALVAAAAAGGAVLLRQRPAAAPGALPADARRIAVAVFANRTGDPSLDPLGGVAADYLARGLAATKLVEVIDVRAEQGGDTTAAARGVARARALARTLGAGSVVWGAYYHQGDSLEFQAQVTDASTGELLGATTPATGPAARPMEGVEALRQRLMSTFAARLDPRFTQYQSPSASRPASYEAYREFLVGDQLGGIACPPERDCLGEAITRYWRAYALDSSFTLPIVAVAALSGQRGECGRTDSIADALRPRHDRLPPFDRARLDWVVAYCNGQPAQALEASREAMATSPRSDQLLESSAWFARQNGLLHEAITTTEKLDSARHARDRGYWSNQVTPYHLLGEYRRELEAAQRGRRFLPADPEMLSFEARALVGLGRLSDVNALLDEVERAPKDAPVVIWMDNLGRELRAHGHQREAQAVFERALRRYRGLPRDHQQGRRGDLALILEDLERWQEAWPILTQIAAESPDDVALQGALGGLAARRGDRGEVQRIDGWLADRKGGDPAFWRARMAAVLGDRDRAVALFRQAVGGGLGFDVRYGVHTDPAFDSVRADPLFQELTRPKD